VLYFEVLNTSWNLQVIFMLIDMIDVHVDVSNAAQAHLVKVIEIE
jgi:hypothetical protein